LAKAAAVFAHRRMGTVRMQLGQIAVDAPRDQYARETQSSASVWSRTNAWSPKRA
jgi:hypothetical protein